MTPSDALALVRQLMECYPQATMAPQHVMAYAKNLGDLDAEVLDVAIKRCIATCRFLPSIAEIRDEAARVLDTAPDVDEAWAMVMSEVRRVGYNGTPAFPHSRIGDAVKAVGGWWELCQSDNMPADRATFRKAYEASTTRSRQAITLAGVPAIAEAKLAMLTEGVRA